MENELRPTVHFRIVAKHSGKCLDVSGAGMNDGDRIHQWDCGGADNQLWQLIPVGSGRFKIVAKHSGKCLDVSLARKVNETRVHQWKYVGAPNQHWEITPVDDVHCKIVAQHSGRCLQVGGTTYLGNGSEINQLDYVGGENQKWLLVADIVSFSNYFTIVSKQGIKNSSSQGFHNDVANLTKLHWRIERLENGVHTIVAKHDDSAGKGASKVQWKPIEGENQTWAIVPVGDIFHKILALPTGKCLQASSETFREVKSAINQSEYVGADNQLWLLIPELDGKLVSESTGEIYWITPHHRILIPDEDRLEALGGDTTQINLINEHDLIAKPLWPYLGTDRLDENDQHSVNSLVKVITRCALWAGRGQIGEPTPRRAIGLLDRLENKTEQQDGIVPSFPLGQFSLGGREEWEKGKTGVFLSHSNKDKPLARRIAEDLRQSGVYVWLDEWEIGVGDSITQEIQKGLQQTDFVAVMLSRHSIESGWVEKEWQSKIGAEAEQRKVIILPLKCDECRIPLLLKDKKYADFSRDYQTAFNELLSAIKKDLVGRIEEVPSFGTLGSLRFITEGGTNRIFFSIANASYGTPVTLSAIGVKSYQHGRLLAGVPRISLANLIEGAEMVDHNLAAVNLSSGDFFVLGREVIKIEPGEVVSFSLCLCRRELDRYRGCRLVARLLGANQEYYLPSDCVYLLKSGDTYSPEGTWGGPDVLGRVLIRAAVPVADVLRRSKKTVHTYVRSDYGGKEKEISYTEYAIQIDGEEYKIPDTLLKTEYSSDDLNYRD